jgi:hypothetical protein
LVDQSSLEVKKALRAYQKEFEHLEENELERIRKTLITNEKIREYKAEMDSLQKAQRMFRGMPTEAFLEDLKEKGQAMKEKTASNLKSLEAERIFITQQLAKINLHKNQLRSLASKDYETILNKYEESPKSVIGTLLNAQYLEHIKSWRNAYEAVEFYMKKYKKETLEARKTGSSESIAKKMIKDQYREYVRTGDAYCQKFKPHVEACVKTGGNYYQKLKSYVVGQIKEYLKDTLNTEAPVYEQDPAFEEIATFEEEPVDVNKDTPGLSVSKPVFKGEVVRFQEKDPHSMFSIREFHASGALGKGKYRVVGKEMDRSKIGGVIKGTYHPENHDIPFILGYREVLEDNISVGLLRIFCDSYSVSHWKVLKNPQLTIELDTANVAIESDFRFTEESVKGVIMIIYKNAKFKKVASEVSWVSVSSLNEILQKKDSFYILMEVEGFVSDPNFTIRTDLDSGLDFDKFDRMLHSRAHKIKKGLIAEMRKRLAESIQALIEEENELVGLRKKLIRDQSVVQYIREFDVESTREIDLSQFMKY